MLVSRSSSVTGPGRYPPHFPGRPGSPRRPVILVLCVIIGAALEKMLHRGTAALPGTPESPVKRRPAVLVLRVGIGAALKKMLHHRVAALPGGPPRVYSS
jgi:hypothetical protein